MQKPTATENSKGCKRSLPKAQSASYVLKGGSNYDVKVRTGFLIPARSNAFNKSFFILIGTITTIIYVIGLTCYIFVAQNYTKSFEKGVNDLSIKETELRKKVDVLEERLEAALLLLDENEDGSEENDGIPRNSGARTKRRAKRGCLRRKREHCKNEHRTDMSAVEFAGADPGQIIPKGPLGPWYNDGRNNKNFTKFGLVLDESSVYKLSVKKAGLYSIYAQVFYVSKIGPHSFTINVVDGNKADEAIAICSKYSAKEDVEITCFTSAVRYLKVGDFVYLKQREPNRQVLYEKGQTFFGVVFLGS